MSCATKIAIHWTLPVVFFPTTGNCAQSDKNGKVYFSSLKADNACYSKNENGDFNPVHRSWNITQQTGYRITAVVLKNGEVTEYQLFMEGRLQKPNLYGAVPLICYNQKINQYLSLTIKRATFITLVTIKIK